MDEVFLIQSGGKLLNNHIEYNNVIYHNRALGGGINAGGPIQPLPWVVLRGNRINHNKAISSDNEGTGGGIENNFNLISKIEKCADQRIPGASEKSKFLALDKKKKLSYDWEYQDAWQSCEKQAKEFPIYFKLRF